VGYGGKDKTDKRINVEMAQRLVNFNQFFRKASLNNIPASLTPFFQEYDLEQLDLERSAETIIERILQFGNQQEIRWLFSQYPHQRIRDWVQRWGKMALPEPHQTFWRLVLDLGEPS
jgi:bacterioferritin (cytochrome b1)